MQAQLNFFLAGLNHLILEAFSPQPQSSKVLVTVKIMGRLNYGGLGEMMATVSPLLQVATTASCFLRFKFRGDKDACGKGFQDF